MAPYFFLILFPILVYIMGLVKGKHWNKTCIWMFFILLIILLALRGVKTGVDLQMYSDSFSSLSNYSIDSLFMYSKKGEYLFYILNKLVYFFGGNFQFFLLVVALISVLPIAFLYSKKSNNAILTIVLFATVAPFTMFFSGLRQSIAMGIIIFAFRFIQSKNFKKYILCVIIAIFFHKSASICIILYPLYYANFTKRWLFFIVPLIIFTYIFNVEIFSVLLHLYNPIYEDTYGAVVSTGQYTMLILLILFLAYCYIFPDQKKIDRELLGLRNILIVSVIFQCFVPINYMVMRMNYYNLLFIPILIPKVLEFCNNKKLLYFLNIIMDVFFTFYFFYNGYFGNDILEIFPYVPFWR